jgi:hypothetical protein
MKAPFHLALAVALAPLACRATDVTPVLSVEIGDLKGERYEVEVLLARVVRGPKWNPEKSEPPISPKQATDAARRELKMMIGGLEEKFECSRIELRPGSGIGGDRNAHWYYCISFREASLASGPREGQLAKLPFVVYLDGTVGRPEKKG